MQSKDHWENIYSSKATDEVSWFQAHAAVSLRLIRETGEPLSAAIIDVGGGASTLVDDLLAEGYGNLTVLDISGSALAAARQRLGALSSSVTWIEANVTEASLAAQTYDIWHDRAVFHFLITPGERRAYVAAVRQAVKPGGHVIVATFAADGPAKCSGLPVMRYGPHELHAEFGAPFVMLEYEQESHHTPAGSEQKFVYCHCRKAVS
ncbi:MAG: class I SAM-dependent methyltransferase [Gammaproteobacteria bacterium]|nr:class I SAM-dependent methyltransferase [Gammaproteobacteria bacterium]